MEAIETFFTIFTVCGWQPGAASASKEDGQPTNVYSIGLTGVLDCVRLARVRRLDDAMPHILCSLAAQRDLSSSQGGLHTGILTGVPRRKKEGGTPSDPRSHCPFPGVLSRDGGPGSADPDAAGVGSAQTDGQEQRHDARRPKRP